MKRCVSYSVSLLVLVVPLAGLPATITVNSVSDELADDTNCTLREAIIAANQDADSNGCVATNLPYGADRIVFDPALAGQPIVLTRLGTGEAFALTGDLDITDDLIIDGDPGGTEIDANQIDRVFDVRISGTSVTFNRLRVTGGNPPPASFDSTGGGIRVDMGATLTLNDCVVILNGIGNDDDNPNIRGGGISTSLGSVLIVNRSEVLDNSLTGASGLVGGGIESNESSVFIFDSRISGNSVTQSDISLARGGGIYSQNDDTLVIVRSEVSSNVVTTAAGTASGGGVYSIGGTRVILINSTFSDNLARTDSALMGQQAIGGGVFRSLSGDGSLVINSSTIYDNAVIAMEGAAARSGGLQAFGGDVDLANTIIANNSSNGAPSDCLNGFIVQSSGFNLVETNCGIDAASGDLFGISPMLGPLAFNGGTNTITDNPRTHMPLSGSAAIDAGNPATPDTFPACTPTDQRGFVRPGNTGSMRCDIGAHEFNSPGPEVLFSDGFES